MSAKFDSNLVPMVVGKTYLAQVHDTSLMHNFAIEDKAVFLFVVRIDNGESEEDIKRYVEKSTFYLE